MKTAFFPKILILGMAFGAFSICTIVLPMLQNWVRREKFGFLASTEVKDTSVKNLKQTTGIFTELIVEYISEYNGNFF